MQARIAQRARRLGPIPFSEFMDSALYDPEDGFFSTGGAAGRRGDFLTSPEVGPLFGAVAARALDEWWEELGRPDPFLVVEPGAGTGALARDVLAARRSCSSALRYVLVERSRALREAQAARVALEPPSSVLGPVTPSGGDGHMPVEGTGPLATSLEELPGERFTGVIFANELLDNLPVVLLERRGERWSEVRVGARGSQLTEVLVPADVGHQAAADHFAPDAPEGGRIPLQRAATAWLRRCLALLDRGRLVVVDYGDTTSSMGGRPWREWLRTYRRHGRGAGPLEEPGCWDITCEVALDQLSAVSPPSSDRSQADFLTVHGLEDLVAEARGLWREKAALGDLEALKARSRVSEAAALTDPGGLGAFRVLEWTVPPPTTSTSQ